MNENEELLDLVDKSDRVIGRISRGEGIRLGAEGGRYIRFAAVLIADSNDKVWFPVRSLKKL